MSPRSIRIALVGYLGALAFLALLSLSGGPDPLGAASSLLYALALLTWFGVELRTERARRRRTILRCCLAAAILLVAASAVELMI
jgi:hypothetical protein